MLFLWNNSSPVHLVKPGFWSGPRAMRPSGIGHQCTSFLLVRTLATASVESLMQLSPYCSQVWSRGSFPGTLPQWDFLRGSRRTQERCEQVSRSEWWTAGGQWFCFVCASSNVMGYWAMAKGLQHYCTQVTILSWLYGKHLTLQNIRGLPLFLFISVMWKQADWLKS